MDSEALVFLFYILIYKQSTNHSSSVNPAPPDALRETSLISISIQKGTL